MKRVPYPLLVIGLDGASPQVLDALAERLPHITQLRREGASGVARSTQPPATFPAWTSVLTGCPPEVHGIRDMLTRDTPTSVLRPVSGVERRVPLIVQELARAGHSVACLGVPGLHPPPQESGAWIAGFDAPGADQAGPGAVFPPSLYREVRACGGWRYATFNEQRFQLEAATDALISDIDDKARLIQSVARSRRWDLFFVHLQASDTACHHLWPSWDRSSPRAEAYEASDALPRVFERLDRLVGELCANHRGRVLLVSDHGFGGASVIGVHLNRLLERLGLLHFQGPSLAKRALAFGARTAAARLPASLTATVARAGPSWLLGTAIQAARQAPVADDTVAFSDELDYAPSLWLRRPLDRQEEARLFEALRGLKAPNGKSLVRAIHRQSGVGQGPAYLVEAEWIDGYRPCFLPSLGPGDPVRLLEPEEYRAGRGMGMPGVHHPDGVVAVYGEGVTPQPLSHSLPEIGASIPTLMGLAHLHHPGRAAPALSSTLGLSVSDTVEMNLPQEAQTPKVSAALTQRLMNLGYL